MTDKDEKLVYYLRYSAEKRYLMVFGAHAYFNLSTDDVCADKKISGLAIRHPLVASTLAACIFLLILSLAISFCMLPLMFSTTKDKVNYDRQTKSEPPPSLSSRLRSRSIPLRKRRSKITRRSSGSLRTVGLISLLPRAVLV